MTTSSPTIAVVAAGAMGSAIGARLTSNGCTVYTNLNGRSEDTKERAKKAGMKDATIEEIARKCDWFISVLPPSEAFSLAEKVLAAAASLGAEERKSKLVYVDANAVNPETVKRIYGLFEKHRETFTFVDASVIGGPPSVDGSYDPVIYASAHLEDVKTLDAFVELNAYGMKIKALKGEGAGIGDASALKMSYAGITKGITGLFTTMILSAHASSPATAQALLQELNHSQPVLLERITKGIPSMIPKAYRWVGEMEEIAGFVGKEGMIYEGIGKMYRRIEESRKGGGEDVEVLERFVADAKEQIGS